MSIRSMIGNLVRSAESHMYRWRIKTTYPELKTALSITSHLTIKERYRLFKLAQGKTNILEIGSYVGCSATCFGAMLSNQGNGRIFCIDTWNNDAMTEGGRDTYQAFTNNTQEFNKFIVPVRGFSTEVAGEVSRQTDVLDLLFIDGDHSYEGAKNDWETYKKFLKPGAVVVMHDVGWAEGVQRVVKEDLLPIVSSHGNLPNLWWGTLR